MKKLFLTLAAIITISLTGLARTTLADAYKSLSSLPGMEKVAPEKVQVTQAAAISNLKTSAVSVSDKAGEYRDKFIYMMENLPVRDMVIGANNQRDIAAVYAEPAGYGKYNVLILTGNVEGGDFTASYGQTTSAGVKAIRACQVSMDPEELVIVTTSPGDVETFFGMAD